MLLDRIDIDAHGPLNRVELGPMAEHLNVVFAPDGSGKTAISRFVRDALVDRAYPLGMFSSSTGRVVLGDRHGMVHCHREKDGTPQGRRRVVFESRGDFQGRFDLLENPWLRGISKTTDAGAAIASLEVPESIVDGVITDTSGGSVARVVSACVRSGLDAFGSYHGLPLHDDLVYAERNGRDDGYGQESYERHRRLRRELADVEAELARLSHDETSYDALVARRNRLTERLARPGRPRPTAPTTRRRELEQRSAALQHRARDLRSQQSELRRRLADLELDIASCDMSREHLAGKTPYTRSEYHVLCRDRDEVQHQLDRATASLDACLTEATDVVRALRTLASADGLREEFDSEDQAEREALTSELRRIDDRLAVLSRIQWLRTQRSEILKQLRVIDWRPAAKSPLAEAASRWLVRLSGGRLRRVDWPHARFDRQWKSHHREEHVATGVRIDGRDEVHCEVVDRVLASLAVRLAAGDFLARSGRHVPLVLEISESVYNATASTHATLRASHAYHEHGDHLRSNHPLAAALRDYVHGGRQVLVLTSSPELARQLGRVGARSFRIHTHRLMHPHRPMWRPHYHGETYVGPHPHTYADRDAEDVSRSRSFYKGPAAEGTHVDPNDINRDLDVAWRESQRATANPVNASNPVNAATFAHSATDVTHASARSVPDTSARTDWARDGVLHRDGYYFVDTFTTDAGNEASPDDKRQEETATSGAYLPMKKNAVSPFYLSVDSPIDQAPSIDAVAAARLRGLKVTHITHLMQSDPNRLSDALGLASVDAATIRRWQAECRLACRVPNLRGFDARVLVGCGVTTPGQLAAMHPIDLLHEVEGFLATERGQQVLLSGTSQELSRLMTWIATANSARSGFVHRDRDAEKQFLRRRRIIREMNERESMLHRGYRSWREDALDLDSPRSDEPVAARSSTSDAERSRRKPARDARLAEVPNESTDTPTRTVKRKVREEVRFYLHRDSPVVDAPSIGPKMAARLNRIGIQTVNDLLAADPETLAGDLNHPRVDADTVLQWQQQATLVCRVPMLRGHDAQLLVSAEVTTPEELAESDANDLFEIVDLIARSNEGQRILRGGSRPDLKEVHDWIRWAKYQRSLRAA